MRSKAHHKPSSATHPVKFRDMYSIVKDVLIKMEHPGTYTSFKLEEREIFDNLIEQIRRECPTLVQKLDKIN
jgi:isocitrate dehydrogenase kinase/phosphatase